MTKFKKYECSICNDIMKSCIKKGKGAKCEKLIDDFYDDKISEKEFTENLEKEIGEKEIEKL